jgi:hypothetical protein
VAVRRSPQFEDRREVKMVVERLKTLSQSRSRRDRTVVPIVDALAKYRHGLVAIGVVKE